MKWWLLLFACALAAPVQAQDWATRELCLIEDAQVHRDAFDPEFFNEMQARAARIPNGLGRYWKITSQDGAVSHLWGTMHSSLPLILDLPDRVIATIEEARVVATEVDYTQQNRAELTTGYVSLDRYYDGAGLSIRDMALPQQMLGWIEARLIGLGWGEDAFDYLKPEAIAELLLSDPCGDFAAGIYPIQDDRIQMLGAIAGAEILSLEAPRALFKKLSDDSNVGLTRAMIAVYANYLNPDITREAFSTSFALYLQGQIATMMAWDELYFDTAYPNGEGAGWLRRTNDYLLRERNEVFMTSAMNDLRKGGVFMAVGAYHLPHEFGLIALMRDAGFTVERVILDGEVRP